MARVTATISERVVHEVANSSNTNMLELPPLYDCMDPDALDALIDTMADGQLSFTYADHTVTVTSDGTIRLHRQPTASTGAASAMTDD